MNCLYIHCKQEMQVYPYVLITKGQFVVRVVNCVMLDYSLHLNIAYNLIATGHRWTETNTEHRFVGRVVMLRKNLGWLNRHLLEAMYETMAAVLAEKLLPVLAVELDFHGESMQLMDVYEEDRLICLQELTKRYMQIVHWDFVLNILDRH